MNRKKGIVCGLLSGMFWAFSSTVGQVVLQGGTVSTEWLIPVRMLSGGMLLTAVVWFTDKEELISLWNHKKDFLWACLAGICGNMMIQYMFFRTVQASNATTATVFQFLAPILLVGYSCITEKRRVKRREILACILVVAGVALVCTHGNPNEMSITPDAIRMGLLIAVFMAIHSLLPKKLYDRYSAQTVLCVSLLAGGLVLGLCTGAWTYSVNLSLSTVLGISVTVVFGCVLGYLMYGISVKEAGPAGASVYCSSEPVFAALISALFLSMPLGIFDVIGLAMVVGSVVVLSKE
ncbi:MAG: EamA family transporter [Erysipelotrichaceae bacterium]|nr:EamA family transporter [Erysipelotrichaceae bacterium]